jgi:hypothetical protein
MRISGARKLLKIVANGRVQVSGAELLGFATAALLLNTFTPLLVK